MRDLPPAVWVFGAFRGGGHHLHGPYGARVIGPDHHEERLCDGVQTIAPRGRLTSDDVMPEGEIAKVGGIGPEWSYVSWWDRRGDDRHGSHTGILARGAWSPWHLVAAARELCPWSIRVPLGPWAAPPPVPTEDSLCREAAAIRAVLNLQPDAPLSAVLATIHSEAARIGGGVGVTLSQAADRIEELERERDIAVDAFPRCRVERDEALEAGRDNASACDLWITYDPETGYEEHNTEAAGYAALDALLDEHTDRAAESVHEQVESVALYRCERVAGIVQTVTATSEDDTEDGAWCRERGFDYKVELSIGRKDDR